MLMVSMLLILFIRIQWLFFFVFFVFLPQSHVSLEGDEVILQAKKIPLLV